VILGLEKRPGLCPGPAKGRKALGSRPALERGRAKAWMPASGPRHAVMFAYAGIQAFALPLSNAEVPGVRGRQPQQIQAKTHPLSTTP